MTIRTGREILNRLRRKLGNKQYAIYEDLNEAQEWIAQICDFTWLRETSIDTLALLPDENEYSLDVSNAKAIEKLWAAGVSTEEVGDISSITLPSGDVVVIETDSAHGRSTGDNVTFSDISGTTELNDEDYAITVLSTTTFSLDGTDGDDFTAYVSGGTVSVYTESSSNWKKMIEVPTDLFEEKVKENLTSSVVDDSQTITAVASDAMTERANFDWYYSIRADTSSSNPSPANKWKIKVTPTPSQKYKLKVDYIRIQSELTDSGYPDIPYAFINCLINYAAGIILETDEKPFNVARGLRYLGRAENDALKIVLASQKNRGDNIDRRKRAWIK